MHRCVVRKHANCHKWKIGVKFFKEGIFFFFFFTIQFENMIFSCYNYKPFLPKSCTITYISGMPVTVERTIELLEKQIDTSIRFVGNPKKPSRRNSFLILTTTECQMNIEF